MTQTAVTPIASAPASRPQGTTYNRVELTGFLAKDPEAKTTTTGKASVRLRLATNELRGSEYHDVTVYAAQADWCLQNVGKGDKVQVSGRLRSNGWKTPEGDFRRYVDVIANSVSLIRRPASAEIADTGAEAA
jgi:single-strand DNA-binding protein